MGVFSRVRDIVSSNINAMLDRAEHPEKLVRLMIQEMEDTLVEIKASCAGAMAARNKTQRALDECRERARSWGQRAELAVGREREDLAREALLEKRRYLQRLEILEQEMGQTQDIITQYQEQIAQLEEKLATAREKQRLLVQRHVHARERKRAQEDIRRFETSDVFMRFEQFENRIERMEAEADMVNFGRTPCLEDEFARLTESEEIERELEALRAKSGRKVEEDRAN
jgi:phage shock protein A